MKEFGIDVLIDILKRKTNKPVYDAVKMLCENQRKLAPKIYMKYNFSDL